jgi:acyl-CoA synthetase (AMP-forming)/AMP-acid ligase II
MNLAQLFLRTASRDHDLPAVSRGGERWSYAEFARRVAGTAAALRRHYHLADGARVAIAMENCPAFLQVLFAAWHAGVCAVPINAKLHPREMAYILANSGASLCFTSPALYDGIVAETRSLTGLQIIPTESRAFAGLADTAAIAPVDVGPQEPAWLFYTSGTTGRPKGAILTGRNLIFMTNCYYADIDTVAPGESMIHAAPMSHGGGLYSLPHIAQGGHQIIPESGHFDPEEIFALLRRAPGVSFFAAPTMLVRLMASGSAGSAALDNLRTIIYGGAPMYVADLERAIGLFGPRLAQIYGQGESPMTITGLSKAEHIVGIPGRLERLASSGIARTGIDVRTVDAEGRDVPIGEIGEVITRSDCVMAGYWNNPDATTNALRDGWLYTGDIGAFDDESYLTLKDRSKDLIISGGSNIYPREIEEVLLTHADVVEASVIGSPHPEWGEEVVAVVVRFADRVDATQLDKLCLENLARFKRPRRYVFLDELPKNNYGKILKSELRLRLGCRETKQN